METEEFIDYCIFCGCTLTDNNFYNEHACEPCVEKIVSERINQELNRYNNTLIVWQISKKTNKKYICSKCNNVIFQKEMPIYCKKCNINYNTFVFNGIIDSSGNILNNFSESFKQGFNQ